MYTYIPSFLSIPPTPHCISPFQVITEHWSELAVSYTNFPLAIYFTHGSVYMGFPGSSADKESTCNAGDPRLIPGLERCPLEGIDYPLQYFVVSDSKESTGNGGDLGWIPGLGKSPGEGHDNPLRYSCLENPMDREA